MLSTAPRSSFSEKWPYRAAMSTIVDVLQPTIIAILAIGVTAFSIRETAVSRFSHSGDAVVMSKIVRALCEPWLDASARHFQSLIEADSDGMREKAQEGKYVIQTEEQNLSAVEAVAAYKELNEVERGFSHLKALLELRPVHHHQDTRVQAHVFVAVLALLLDRALEKSLRAAGSNLSIPFAWQALEMVRCVEVQLGQRRKLCVTLPSTAGKCCYGP